MSRLWSDSEIERAARMWRANGDMPVKDKCALIGAALGRETLKVRARFYDYGPAFKPSAAGRRPLRVVDPPAVDTGRLRALAERDARAALYPASLTAAFFGDPLPGRSALDKLLPGRRARL